MYNSHISQIADVEDFSPETINFPKVTIIDCMDSFTHNLVQLFVGLGAPVNVMKVNTISLSVLEQSIGEYLVLSPGPGRPSDFPNLTKILEKYLSRLPILGVCLGFQAINEFFGGITTRSNEIVHGKAVAIHHDGMGIFRDIPSPTLVTRYHSLKITSYPNDFLIHSVYNDIPMAYSISKMKVHAVQFHPESFLTTHGPLIMKNFLEEYL